MFKEVAGDHCERCLAPIQKDFHSNYCRVFHGHEYLCPSCVQYVETNVPRLIGYLKEYGGCLFQELSFAEERLSIKISR